MAHQLPRHSAGTRHLILRHEDPAVCLGLASSCLSLGVRGTKASKSQGHHPKSV